MSDSVRDIEDAAGAGADRGGGAKGAAGAGAAAGGAGGAGAEPALQEFSSMDAGTMQTLLLPWYDTNRRVMPWRGDEAVWPQMGDPGSGGATVGFSRDLDDLLYPTSIPVSAYAIWVSEVMCQQTRVDTVIPYYTRWMKHFPTVQELADATPEQVEQLWAGLGYYRRARNLHKGAKMVVSDYDGELPLTAAELVKIPGIGKYTAGAIASISSGEVTPVVDGNVIRVIARLRAIELSAKDTKLVKFCWKEAAKLVDPVRPGDFNQAMMELGATVCTPKAPACDECPVRALCKGNCVSVKEGLGHEGVLRYPAKTVKKASRIQLVSACVVVRKRSPDDPVFRGFVPPTDPSMDIEILVMRRPPKGLLARRWEYLCSFKDHDGATDPAEVAWPLDERKELASDLAKKTLSLDLRAAAELPSTVITDCGRNAHIFSHVKHELRVHRMEVGPAVLGEPEHESATWVHLQRVFELGLTAWASKMLLLALKPAEIETIDSELIGMSLEPKAQKRFGRALAAPPKRHRVLESFFGSDE